MKLKKIISAVQKLANISLKSYVVSVATIRLHQGDVKRATQDASKTLLTATGRQPAVTAHATACPREVTSNLAIVINCIHS